jgi:hypothetical protein
MKAVLARKEKQLDSILFLGSPKLLPIVKENARKIPVSHVRGPMDAFLVKK